MASRVWYYVRDIDAAANRRGGLLAGRKCFCLERRNQLQSWPMNTARPLFVLKLLLVILCLTFSALVQSVGEAQEVKLGTSFIDPPGRLGFFQVTAAFENYTPPEREVIFIFIPGGDASQDANARRILEHFISGLNPYDTFNILYPSKAFIRTDSTFNKALQISDEDQGILSRRWVFAESISRESVSPVSLVSKISALRKSVAVTNPQIIVGLIESAVRRTKGSPKTIVEIVVIFTPPEGGYDYEMVLPRFSVGELEPGAFIDIESLSRAITSSRHVPRISFFNYGAGSRLDKPFRRLAAASNGFYIGETEDALVKAEKAASLLRKDFLRSVSLRLLKTDANFVHNDMWDMNRVPHVLTLTGRCSELAGTIIAVEDFKGNVITETEVVETPARNPSVPRKWAELRAAEALRNILTYGEDRFMLADLDFLKREWGVDAAGEAVESRGGPGSGQNFTRSPERDEKSARTAGKEKLEGEIPPHSTLAEMVPGDSLYVLFPSISSIFSFLDTIHSASRELTGALDVLPDIRSQEEKVKTRLALLFRRKYARMYDAAVSEVAVGSDDFLDPTNLQLTLFFKLKHPLLFRMRLAEYRSRMRREYPGLMLRKLRYKGRKIIALTGEMGEISSYLTYMKMKDGKTVKVAVLSNSLQSLKKAIDTANGTLPPIAQDEMFLGFRAQIPYRDGAEKQKFAFICVGEGPVGRINSKRYRFVHEERKKRRSRLQELDDALTIFKREYPNDKVFSVGALVDKKVLGKHSVEDPAEEYYYDDKTGVFVSKIFNRLGYLGFIDDIAESELPMPSLVSKRDDLVLDNVAPMALELKLGRDSVQFSTVVLTQPQSKIHKMVEAVLSRRPSETIARKLDWHGYLFSFQTDIFTSRTRGFTVSKERLLLNAVIMQLRRKLKAELKWKGKKDVLGWVGNEIVIGFEEIRLAPEDFICSSKGFLIVEVRDLQTAKAFLDALAREFGENDESGRSHYVDEIAGIRAALIDGFFFAGISDRWMVISNDRDVFSRVVEELALPDEEPTSEKSNVGVRLVIGKGDALGKMKDRLLTDYGRWNAARLSYQLGNNAQVLSSPTRQVEFGLAEENGFFLDGDMGLAASVIFGPGKASMSVRGEPYPPLDRDGVTLNINGRLFKDRAELAGSAEFESLETRRKASLTIPYDLAAISRRLSRTTLSDFLVETMDDADPWLSSIAQQRLSELGASAMRPLLRLYYSGSDRSKVRVLRILRGMKLKDVRRHLPRLYRKRASESDEVIEELYRTLVHFGYPKAVAHIEERIADHTVQPWELEIVRDEQAPQLIPALVAYIMGIGDDIDGSRELRQWLAAGPVGGRTNLSLCLSALSEIGKAALPEMLKRIPQGDERQKALTAFAILNMPDIVREDLASFRTEQHDKEVREFLEEVLKELNQD